MKESAQNAGDAFKDKMSSMKESVSDKFKAKPFEGFRGNPSMFNVHLVNVMSVPDKCDSGKKAGAKRAW